jgi:calcineurin-like phosphoesterase family protein
MGGQFFTSDTHFTHAMVGRLRGFDTAPDHDEAIVANWNAAVGRDDTVWHLGDVGLGKPAEILPWVARLNGTIHLITGNHDAPWPAHRDAHRTQRLWLQYFASIQQYARRKIDGTEVLLSHFPYYGDHSDEDRHTQYRLRDEGKWLLHGHTHGAERAQVDALPFTPFRGEPQWRGKMVHVGLDAWNLRPVAAETISKIITDLDATQNAVADCPTPRVQLDP